MKAYIAGMITGDPNYKDKFQVAKSALEAEEFVVMSPAWLPEGMQPADYMRICFAMMESVDIVAFLPDYEKSRGAMLEYSWCQYVGKQTYFLEGTTQYELKVSEYQDKLQNGERPLTVAELKERIGEPVYIVDLNHRSDPKTPDLWSGWIVFTDCREWGFVPRGGGLFSTGGYGETWLAYRSKPSEDAKGENNDL